MPRLKSSTIALYGGTFDPPHLGHLLGAQDAVDQLKLDRLVFIPCGISPHKLGKKVSPGRHRHKMLQLAIRENNRMEVSDVEIRREGPSYAIETVEHFRRMTPTAKFYWIIGADQIPKLKTWEQYSRLRKLVTFLVLSRKGNEGKLPSGVIGLPQPRWIDISSTEIRNRVKNNLRMDWMVPDAVKRYMVRYQLYSEKQQ